MHYRLGLTTAVLLCLGMVVGCGGGQNPTAKSQMITPAHRPAPMMISPAQQGELYGDLDGDEQPGVGDAIKILRIVVALDPENVLADANRNGGTDVGDAIKVLRCVVGLDSWPIARYGGSGSVGLTEAMTAPEATSPVPESSGDAAVDLLESWGDEGPKDIDEVETMLTDFANVVAVNPNSSAGQLGLSLAIVATGAQNAADVLGYYVFPEVGVTSVASLALDDKYSPGRLMNKAVSIVMVRPWHRRMNTVSPQGAIPGQPLTTEEVQDAIRNHILPTIDNALSRLEVLAQEPADTALITYTDPDDGEVYKVYPTDINLIIASLQLVKTFMLQLVAYDLDAGSYNWEIDLYQRDADSNGILEVDEYAPADPFLVLNSGQEMQQAGQALRGGVQRLIDSLDNRTADPRQITNLLLDESGANAADLRSYCQDALGILSGAVTVEMKYAHLNWQTWQWINQGTTLVQLNLSRIWDNPIGDVKDLLPPLTIEPEDLGGGVIEYDYTFEFSDLPDDTMNGVFPDAQIMNNIVEADYQYLAATYGNLEIEITNEAPWIAPPFP